MSIGTLTPSPQFRPLGPAGEILPGALLYSYAAGTADELSVYQDKDCTIPHPYPLELDSEGKAVVYLLPQSYKFDLHYDDDSPVPGWPIDYIQSVGVALGIGAGENFSFGGDATTPITATSYPSGSGIDKIHSATSVLNVDSADLVGTFALEAMLAGDGASIVTACIVNLDDGNPDVALVEISTATTGARVRSSDITFAAAGAAKNYGIKVKVDTGSGYVWGAKLVRTA